MSFSLVFMGVCGCGKSSLAAAVARAEALPMVEGDDFHSAANRSKMQNGVPLTDTDRADWLTTLGQQLVQHPHGVALTCSALKRAYRDTLRAACPEVQFVFLEIKEVDAQARVEARSAAHFFSTSLVQSQFATLESPVGEGGVLRVDATAPLAQLQTQVSQWLHHKEHV